APAGGLTPGTTVAEVERQLIFLTLQHTGGEKKRAGRKVRLNPENPPKKLKPPSRGKKGGKKHRPRPGRRRITPLAAGHQSQAGRGCHYDRRPCGRGAERSLSVVARPGPPRREPRARRASGGRHLPACAHRRRRERRGQGPGRSPAKRLRTPHDSRVERV